jgi:pyruvate/2-oxoglutarate dehydrogenase complex dihydrolipoamide dehydrogenase (E3) component
VVKLFREGSEKQLRQTKGLDLVFGEANFIAHKTLQVSLRHGGSEDLFAEKIFIDAGAKTIIPDIDGVHDIHYLTSTTILDLGEVPEHLLVVGASYIALEFGQLYRRLGSKVTILEHTDRFLRREDDDVSDALKKILEEDGILIHLGATVKKLERASSHGIEATTEISGVVQNIACSHLL